MTYNINNRHYVYSPDTGVIHVFESVTNEDGSITQNLVGIVRNVSGALNSTFDISDTGYSVMIANSIGILNGIMEQYKEES